MPPITAIGYGHDKDTSGDSRHPPATPSADVSGANTELDKFKSDLQLQTAPTLPSELCNDLASLLKDLNSGNTFAAQADASKVQVDLQTQDASSVAATPTGKPLDTLIGQISGSVHSGSVQGARLDGAERDLAKALVENGRGTGSLISLINTSA